MNGLRQAVTRAPSGRQVPLTSIARPSPHAINLPRQISQQSRSIKLSAAGTSRPACLLYTAPLRSRFLPEEIQSVTYPLPSRQFHQSSKLSQEKQAKPADTAAKEEPTEEGSAKKEDTPESESASKGSKAKDEGESSEGKKEEQKEAPPPPPPHGDKTPWQVFTETLQSEFKASKEWNESTKALAEGAHQFTESESVRRARQAYESTTGAVSSTTGKVLKTTAGAVGKGAAWTWETPVVKAARSTVNATASVIEKGTRPIRQTEAYKNVKNVIDDGSSSRYGGWVEKEERRKARELREKQEAEKLGPLGRKNEVPVEDPK